MSRFSYGREHLRSRTIAAYLVNTLVPRDPDIRITAQNRNYQQSFYQLDYVQTGGAAPVFVAWRLGAGGWLGMGALLLSARLVFLWRQRPKASQFLISSNAATTIHQGGISK